MLFFPDLPIPVDRRPSSDHDLVRRAAVTGLVTHASVPFHFSEHSTGLNLTLCPHII